MSPYYTCVLVLVQLLEVGFFFKNNLPIIINMNLEE